MHKPGINTKPTHMKLSWVLHVIANHVKDQNSVLSKKNEELTSIKKQLQSDEEEYVFVGG